MNLKNLARILTYDYWFQNYSNVINRNKKFIIDNQFLFYSQLKINLNNNEQASYSWLNNQINIPKNFYRNQYNYTLYQELKGFYKDNIITDITLHELGHLNHHQSLSLSLPKNYQENSNSKEITYRILNEHSDYIALNSRLSKLLTIDSPIGKWLHLNFMESYADSYSGLIHYIQSKDSTLIKDIESHRREKYNELKNKKIGGVKESNGVLEVATGGMAITQYSNYKVMSNIKNNICNMFSYDNLTKMTIQELHDMIQVEIIYSLRNSMVKEIKNNQLFEEIFFIELKRKGMTLQDYFKEFDLGIKEYKDEIQLKLIHKEIFNSKQIDFNSFIEQHWKKGNFKPLIFFHINIQEEENIYNELQKLNYDNVNLSKEKYKNHIIIDFILPQEELKLYQKHETVRKKILKSIQL